MSMTQAENRKRLQASAVAFADEFLEPIAADLDRTAKFPRALVAELARQALLVLPTVKDSGLTAHVALLQTLSQACPAVASIVNNHALAAYALFTWGTQAQKTVYAAKLGAGEALGAIAMHESGPAMGIGPDALIGTSAGGKLTLNGKKMFVRNAGVADLYVGFATVDAGGAPAVMAFMVDAKAPGLAIGTPYQTMGLRGCPVADITFKNVVLDDTSLLGTAKTGAGIATQLRAAFALGEGAQTVGIGNAAAKHAATAARHRIQFGHPIATLQPIQQLLAEMATDAHFAWHGICHAASLADEGAPFIVEAAMVQSFLGRFGQKMIVDAVQVEGGMGICEVVPPHFEGTLPLARLFRDMAGTTLLDTPGDFPEALVAATL